MENLTLDEVVRLTNQCHEITKHSHIKKHYDNEAMGDNFAMLIKGTIIVVYLPNAQYDTWFADFSNLYNGGMEEFNNMTEIIDYIGEQVENKNI